MGRTPIVAAALGLATLAAAAPAHAAPADQIRIATFNASLNRPAQGQLASQLADMSVDDVPRRQVRNVAEVIQRARPDVVLVNEFDYDPAAVDLLRSEVLEVSQNGAPPIRYPYVFIAPSNTGVASGLDLNDAGGVVTTPGAPGYGDDAFGFGAFPGQFGMVILSRYPIDAPRARTFQTFRWADMPGNRIPVPFYAPEEVEALRLSSKSHWDVPVRVGGRTIHILASHPTPPVFDGPEDRNGRRNADEIRFWADYVSPGRAGYVHDDRGRRGGLPDGARFVIAGDQNADPLDGDGVPGAIQQILDHPLVDDRRTPASPGAAEAAAVQGGANATHRGDPRFDTADFADSAPGNLRTDYVLPRRGLRVTGSGVSWPVRSDPFARLTGTFDAAAWGAVGGFPTSDHRLVWIDVRTSGGDGD